MRSTQGLAIALYVLVGVQVSCDLIGTATPPNIVVTSTSVNVTWGGIAAIGILAGVAAGIVALVWIYRTMCNVHAKGVATKYSPGWAVGCWFIPLANLILPYFPMREAWAKSRCGPTGLLAGWWAAWVVHAGALLGLVLWGVSAGWSLRSSVPPGHSMDAPLPGDFQAVGVAVLHVAAGALFAAVVARLTRSQATR